MITALLECPTLAEDERQRSILEAADLKPE
jgi:hypothetical protein